MCKASKLYNWVFRVSDNVVYLSFLSFFNLVYFFLFGVGALVWSMEYGLCLIVCITILDVKKFHTDYSDFILIIQVLFQ